MSNKDKKFHEIPVGGSYDSWNSSRSESAGITNSTQMNVVKTYGEEKFHGARGHGFAAERANDLWDNMTGNDSHIEGDNNFKDGADRIVNGINIQSKYCSSGSKCIRECFDGNSFRYYLKNPDGTYVRDSNGLRKPMQIEVPAGKDSSGRDIYEDAVKAMQNRIDRGEIEGVKKAEEIVRKGNVTYEQAKNIAKAGTVESLTYDAIDGIRIGAYSGGISAAITFAVSSWNGKFFEEALEDSVKAGLQTSGVAWASSILVGQMTKAGINSMLVPYSDAVVNMIGSKASAHLANAFREGTKIYGGAAMKSASKILRGNAVTGIATVAIMSAGDVVDIFRGRISGSQLIKNVVNKSAEVGGGVGGWASGAAIGSAFGPAGTVIGGFLGAVLGSSATGKISRAVTDKIIEDDAKEMTQILESIFPVIADNYILNKSEIKQVTDRLSGSDLKDMYASNERKAFAEKLLSNYAERVVSRRKKIYLPSSQDYVRSFRNVLEKVADGAPLSKPMLKKYSTKVANIDGQAEIFIKLANRIIIFDDSMVLPELREFFVLHSGSKLTDVIKAGDILRIADSEFKILKVGGEVNNNIKNRGYIAIKFNDDEEDLFEGSIHVEDKPIPKIRIGDEITIIQA